MHFFFFLFRIVIKGNNRQGHAIKMISLWDASTFLVSLNGVYIMSHQPRYFHANWRNRLAAEANKSSFPPLKAECTQSVRALSFSFLFHSYQTCKTLMISDEATKTLKEQSTTSPRIAPLFILSETRFKRQTSSVGISRR